MPYTSYDPRKTIRETIGTVWYEEESDATQYTINVTDRYNETIRVPILLSEEVKTGSIKEMPFLDMNMMLTDYDPHDIGASTRKIETFLDIGLWFTDTDNIDATEFGKKVCDEIINLIRSNQCSIPSVTFINIEEIRHIREPRAHQVVFHYVITCYVLFYDLC